ncbi:MAG: hypothetical protein PHI18_04740 [bacterium]|nr:hypothetical protein [bacterium]
MDPGSTPGALAKKAESGKRKTDFIMSDSRELDAADAMAYAWGVIETRIENYLEIMELLGGHYSAIRRIKIRRAALRMNWLHKFS